jgi:DNA-directed RNA polymerase subunit E'/Rpb7
MSSSTTKKVNKGKIKKSKVKKRGIFMKNVLSRRVILPFYVVGSNIRENIKTKLETNLYNKCTKEGYIRNKSIVILSYSSGVIESDNVIFDVMFECDICHPVEGQLIKCQVKNITRAGIRAIYNTKDIKSPITIFVARDHHYNNEEFSKLTESQDITIQVIGIRYELNDETISVLGELKTTKTNKPKTKVTIIEE